jgi:subtilisin family serine protease
MGAGKSIVILDTGVDKNHPALANKVVSEACYSTSAAGRGITSLCPGGASSSVAPIRR